MIRTLHQAEQKQKLELKKQIFVVYGAAVCVLKELPEYRNYKFTDTKIKEILNETDRILGDQANPMSGYSLPEQCDKETRMVMKLGNKTYKDIYLFNSKEWYRAELGMSDEVKKSHVLETLPWIPLVLESALCTAMHRLYGWGYRKRLPQLLYNIDMVRGECRTADYYMDLLRINYDMDFVLK